MNHETHQHREEVSVFVHQEMWTNRPDASVVEVRFGFTWRRIFKRAARVRLVDLDERYWAAKRGWRSQTRGSQCAWGIEFSWAAVQAVVTRIGLPAEDITALQTTMRVAWVRPVKEALRDGVIVPEHPGKGAFYEREGRAIDVPCRYCTRKTGGPMCRACDSAAEETKMADSSPVTALIGHDTEDFLE